MTANSKPITHYVLLSLVRPTASSFNRTFRVIYCLQIAAQNLIQPPAPNIRYMHTHVPPSDKSLMNCVALLWFEVGQPWELLRT